MATSRSEQESAAIEPENEQSRNQLHSGAGLRGEYERGLAEIRRGFELSGDGLRAAARRAALVDQIGLRLWTLETREQPLLSKGIAIAAIAGYGRCQLFPYSDVDILFCVEKPKAALAAKPLRRLSQQLWDCGLRVAFTTRTPAECERFDPANPEFAISLLDLRRVGGDEAVFARLQGKSVAKLRQRDAKVLGAELARLTRERHARFGSTLFHLEPNIKDCPGGLRDANVAQWLHQLRKDDSEASVEFIEAVAFLAAVRCFLHYRHQRDDNTLDWASQDAAAALGIGFARAAQADSMPVDAASWMRAYFRHARIVERNLLREADTSSVRLQIATPAKRVKLPANDGLRVEAGVVRFAGHLPSGSDPAGDPETVLAAFLVIAKTGARFAPETEERITDAIPLLSANLEEGPGLWRQLAAILVAERAGTALRSMHALGVLELILPEFHGIDALVIRDAYHRYTVDEHTFVLIDTLHDLATHTTGAAGWQDRFAVMLRELQSPELLYLAAILHDTGKGRAGGQHALESARLARTVLSRLEIDAYEAASVLRLIENHLEMSAALRRDIFDAETVRAFAAKVQTHESLRMLTLFTYADIAAVHPDALTDWKAENLWRLSMAAANHLDRNIDEGRVHSLATGDWAQHSSGGVPSSAGGDQHEKVARVLSLAGTMKDEAKVFLEGFPERYVHTRSPETIVQHLRMTQHFAAEPFQMAFEYGPVCEITLVTADRPRLFAGMAAALAGWGMNVVTADAFANANGVVVDTFRFTDTFRTLELNPSERERFVASIRELVSGRTEVEKLLTGRRRSRRRAPKLQVETVIDFDNTASTQSTLLQVVAQDAPGLLRAISLTLSAQGCDLQVALVDTEGDTAIDVFYINRDGLKLDASGQEELRGALATAISQNLA